MVPTRRARNSLPNSPTPNEDFSNLTLPEVRDRLVRNARVLGSTLLTPSTSPSTSSVLNQHMAGPSRVPLNHDPVRAKLESVREGLLARESELLAMGMEGMSMGSNMKVKEEPMSMDMEVKVEPGTGTAGQLGSSPITPSGVRRGSGPLGNGTSGGRSGKQRALDLIRQGESGLAPGTILLPIEQTLSLGNRDYTTQTLDQFNHLSLAKPKQKTYDPLDENARAQALARMNNFMSYKGDGDEDGEGDDDEGGDIFGFDDGEYEGEDDRMGTGGTRARGTGERVDEYGEDEEIWREGADDEYTLGGGNLDQR